MIDCLASKGCELILNEVYECVDLATLLDYAEALFRMMPDPKQCIPLSIASPLRNEQLQSRVEQNAEPELPTTGS